MRLITRLDRLGRHRRFGRRGRVVLMDAPQRGCPDSVRTSTARWHTVRFDDPWPSRG